MNNKIRVLFLDATLHKKDATGITISNLFGGWPKENLFMIGDSESVLKSTEEGYNNTFTLGNDELKHAFPLGIIKSIYLYFRERKLKIMRNQRFSNPKTNDKSNIYSVNQKAGIRKFISVMLGRLFLRLGFDHLFFKCIISDRLDKWITDSNPDYFYVLLSTRHSILFATDVAKKYNKKLIIHIMDDWPTTIGINTLTPEFWNRKINIEFKQLLTFTQKRVAISKLMAEEYQKRFGGDWECFHNPVDLDFWDIGHKGSVNNGNDFNILYSGRLSSGILGTIEIIAECIDEIVKEEGFNICFKIQSTAPPVWIKKFQNTVFNYYQPYNDLPKLFASVDLLLIPYEFEGNGFKFIRLSMPTKVSEYMASNTPILIVAPLNTAIVDYAIKYNWGYTITDKSKILIKKGIKKIFRNQDLMDKTASHAFEVVKERHEIKKVQQEFLAYFICDA